MYFRADPNFFCPTENMSEAILSLISFSVEDDLLEVEFVIARLK